MQYPALEMTLLFSSSISQHRNQVIGNLILTKFETMLKQG